MRFIQIKVMVIALCSPIMAGAADGVLGGNESMDRPSTRTLSLPPSNTPPPAAFSLPVIPEGTSPSTQQQKRLQIRRIVFDGNTVFAPEVLHERVRLYEGREVSLGELEALRLQLTHDYIDQGYLNSGVILKSDAFDQGDLHFTVLEGHVEEVLIHGQEGLREGYIANRLLTDNAAPLNLNTLQEHFQLLLADPLITRMNGHILPGSTSSKSILDVDVTRARPYQLSFLGNNQRPPSIGAEAFGVNGWVRNLTGLGDMLDLTFYTSAGSNRYAGGFAVPITDQNTQAFFRFDEGDSSIQEQPIARIHVASEVHSIEGGISHPFIHTLAQQLNVGGLLAIRKNETFLDGKPFAFVKSSADTQVSVIRAFQDYMQRWENHALSLRSTLSVGIDAFGATPSHLSTSQDSRFFSWLGQMQYAYRLNEEGTQMVVRGNMQRSNDYLLPLERMAIGGMGTVRGYRENQLVRDEGYHISAELHYPLLEPTATSLHISLVPFMDYGSAWNKHEQAQSLFSVGSGVEVAWAHLHTELYYGYALNSAAEKQTQDLQDAGIHFNARLDTF